MLIGLVINTNTNQLTNKTKNKIKTRTVIRTKLDSVLKVDLTKQNKTKTIS